MEQISVIGGNRLEGKIKVSGMKNSALPIIFACLLVPQECIIINVPRVSDVYDSLKILRSMGAIADFCDTNTVLINTKNVTDQVSEFPLVCKMRASSYLMGAMLSRFGKIKMPMPGGCNFGARPLDLHFKGFESLGAKCFEYDGKIEIFSKEKLKSKKIILDKISVGATINMVLATALLDGLTVIENCACEPHVDDLICFLNKCGANVQRKGTTIFCNGVKELHGTEYCIFPDMIEALTYIASVGICRGEAVIDGIVCEHLSNELHLFEQMGFSIKEYGDRLRVTADKIVGADVVTAPYPMFPTDFHPQFASLLCFAQGGGVITDTVFPTRFAYVNELCKMGAKIEKIGNSAYITPSLLHGAEIDATDLRAGASLVLAGLGADGQSTINNVNYIVRGYENIVEKLANIGGKIKLIKGDFKNGSNKANSNW